jgi:MOSC domain-containing protein YiiM
MSDTVVAMRLLQVNVGQPAELVDTDHDRTVLSGIGKQRVDEDHVCVGQTNIDGDGQADLKNHGGIDKAVYVYTHDHLDDWQAEIAYGRSRDAPFGENLSISGLTEDDVFIGDRWQWGEVVLEIAQPRWPCSKLGLHSEHRDMPVRLIDSERSGWYCRVLSIGQAATGGTIDVIHNDDLRVSVREAFTSAKGAAHVDRARAIAAHPRLAASWRDMILARYRKTDSPV